MPNDTTDRVTAELIQTIEVRHLIETRVPKRFTEEEIRAHLMELSQDRSIVDGVIFESNFEIVTLYREVN